MVSLIKKEKKVNYEKLKREIIEEHNKLRTNPSNFIEYLESHKDYFSGKIISKPKETPLQTQEGWSAFQEAINFFKRMKSYKPLKSLEVSEGLSKAAQVHADDIGPKGIVGHMGSDNSTLTERIEKCCQWGGSAGENICFGNKKAIDVISALLVDDGVSTRGHRTNMLNPKFSFVGIGIQQHKTYGICVVFDYSNI